MSAVNTAVTETASAQLTISQGFADFASRFSLDSVPDQVIDYAKLCFADAIGIGLASTSYEFAERGVKAIADLAGEGPHPVIGTAHKLPARDAALLNGLLIHGLDFDDTHPASIIHCSASAVPLVLACAGERGVSGAEALAAYLLAVETDARIGQVANGQFQKVGFHPTGSVGVFGCALAAAYLHILTPKQMAYAQGIALSMSAGSLEFLEDGAWTKRLHPGWAAASAITAASLAGQDFVAPLRAYEGRYGLYSIALQNHPVDDMGDALTGLGKEWETLKVAIKPYPVCHFNHAFIDAALAVRESGDLKPEAIESVTALIHENQSQVVCEPETNKRRPGSDYDAKFSLHFAVATALARGRFTLDELDDDVLVDPLILALCDKITYRHDSKSAYPRYYSGELLINTKDGRQLRHRESVNRGADARPLSADDVHQKFISNAGRAISLAKAERIWNAVMDLDSSADMVELTSSLSQ